MAARRDEWCAMRASGDGLGTRYGGHCRLHTYVLQELKGTPA